MFLVSSCSCLRSIHWSQVLSWEWRCSWSSADRRCSNYIWVINNFIAYWGATYIIGFTVLMHSINFKQNVRQVNTSYQWWRMWCCFCRRKTLKAVKATRTNWWLNSEWEPFSVKRIQFWTWLTFCCRHFKIQFLESLLNHMDWNFTEVCSSWSSWQ